MIRLQKDIGRQGKVLLVAAAAILVLGGYVAWTWRGAATAQSSVAPVQTRHPTPASESEHYGDVLGRYNRRKAEEAERNDASYLSVLSSRAKAAPQATASDDAGVAVTTTPSAVQTALPHTAIGADGSPATPAFQASQSAHAARADVRDPKAAERLADQAQALMASWSAVSHTEARSVESHAATVAAASIARPSATAPLPGPRLKLMEDLEPIGAVLDTEIDTDETSMVYAHVPGGAYAGAIFVASGYKRLNETVDMTFTLMKWRGKSYKVEAKAVDLDSMRSALSGDVSHHYLSRIIIPSLALGLGRAGQLYEKADTESTVSPFGVIQSSTGSPTGKIVTGTVVGGMAQQAGQVLMQDAGQLPAKQVVVARNSAIGIVLLAPVYADAEVGATPALLEQVRPAAAVLPPPAAASTSGASPHP